MFICSFRIHGTHSDQWEPDALTPYKTLIARRVEHPRTNIRELHPSHKLMLQMFPLISSHLVEVNRPEI